MPTVFIVFGFVFKSYSMERVFPKCYAEMKRYISKVWIEDGKICAETKDGLVASYSVGQWPRLSAVTAEQLNDFHLSYTGIHWPQIDEDLSFEGMFNAAGLCERTESEDSICYLA